jgi:hypothetical protein
MSFNPLEGTYFCSGQQQLPNSSKVIGRMRQNNYRLRQPRVPFWQGGKVVHQCGVVPFKRVLQGFPLEGRNRVGLPTGFPIGCPSCTVQIAMQSHQINPHMLSMCGNAALGRALERGLSGIYGLEGAKKSTFGAIQIVALGLYKSLLEHF